MTPSQQPSHERNPSVTSTETAMLAAIADGNDAGAAETTSSVDHPSKPSAIHSEARDTSVCCRDTLRDSLRESIAQRSKSFTKSELLFLEQIATEGSNSDVENALEKIKDKDLFFDHNITVGEDNNIEIGLTTNGSGVDDASRDGLAASVATTERKSLDNVSQKRHELLERRRSVLERRRSDSTLNMATLWMAHESGLAVTSLGSQKSLLMRSSSISSIGSSMSGLSVLFGNRPHPGAASKEDNVFRTRDATSNKGKLPPPRPFPPRAVRSRSMMYRRSNSATIFSPVKSLPKIYEKVKPGHPTRAKSFSRQRRSVTFHQIDEELEFDKDLEVAATTVTPARGTTVRRAVSDSRISLPQEQTFLTKERQQSVSSLGQQSLSSIPSLHHGNELHDSMSINPPSIHQANALRDSMSVMSPPSIHQANPLRDSLSTNNRRSSVESFATSTTFASINPGNPIIAQDSVTSFPSIRPGVPLPREPSTSTIPSLHPAKPIRQDSIASSIHFSTHPNANMTQEEMIQHFGVTDEIAAAWLKLDDSTTNSIPDNVAGEEHKRSSMISTVTLPQFDVSEVPYEASESTASDIVSVPATTSVDQKKPVFFRQASRNVYEGEGVEVTELNDQPLDDGSLCDENDSNYYSYPPDKSVFRRGISALFSNHGSIRTAGSFDDLTMYSNFGQQQGTTSGVFREIRRSLSDDTLSNFVAGNNQEFLLQIPTSATFGTTFTDTFVDDDEEEDGEGGSWGWEVDIVSPSKSSGRFDAWNILQDEYANGYGGAGTLGFKILGTSVNDESTQPHVLSPPLMESLQAFLPSSKSGENFHLKYSMIRDGAYLQTLLKRARGIQYSILAVETLNGEVFGSFTGTAWRKSWNYFGSGESFLWRMRHNRLDPTNGILDQAQKESEIDVYPYTGANDFIQFCTHDRIAIGGGIPKDDVDGAEKKTQTEPVLPLDHDYGFGLALGADLLEGTSSPCMTFDSPSLCKSYPNGERFEVMNVELWTMTPCMTEDEAERLELGKLFLSSKSSI